MARSTLRAMRISSHLLILLAVTLLSGCYYGHLAMGQWQLIRGQMPINDLLAKPDLDPELREKLSLVEAARSYASTQLQLPDNDSYRRYKALGRPHVVWNVFAAPALSIEAKTWCHLLVGCLAYRGYFDEDKARQEAARLSQKGWDTYVGGVSAYSTLGWFDDPLLDTMLAWSPERLVGLLFHEISHQRLFVEGDTQFNESYASFVELQGLRQWLAEQGRGAEAVEAQLRREADFSALIQQAREDLAAIYAGQQTEADKRQAKQQRIDVLRGQYRALRDGAWNGYAGYDRWFASEINNAKLAPVALYNQWLPAFEQLFDDNDRNWAKFHLAAAILADMPEAERRQRLQQLAAGEPDA